MTQSFQVALVGFEPMRRHQSDPTLTTLPTTPRPHKHVTAPLGTFVNVAHYPEITPTLMKVLKQYGGALTLPSETQGVTQRVEHHSKLKPNTKPVPTHAYKPPPQSKIRRTAVYL